MLIDIDIDGLQNSADIKDKIAKALGINSDAVGINGEDFAAVKMSEKDIENSFAIFEENNLIPVTELSEKKKYSLTKECLEGCYDEFISPTFYDVIDEGLSYEPDEIKKMVKTERDQRYAKLDPVTRFRREFDDFVNDTGIATEHAFREGYDTNTQNDPHKFSYGVIYSSGGGFDVEFEFKDVHDLLSKLIKSLPKNISDCCRLSDMDENNLDKRYRNDMNDLLKAVYKVKGFCLDYQKALNKRNNQGKHF